MMMMPMPVAEAEARSDKKTSRDSSREQQAEERPIFRLRIIVLFFIRISGSGNARDARYAARIDN